MIWRWTVLHDSKKAGEVTSAVYSPRVEKNIGFALLDNEYADPGTRLDVAVEVFEDGDDIDVEGLLGIDDDTHDLTAEDLKPLNLHYMPTLAGDVQAVLADEKVLFQNQEVAFVIAEDRYVAADAIELVEVEYEELPVIIDQDKAQGVMRAITRLRNSPGSPTPSAAGVPPSTVPISRARPATSCGRSKGAPDPSVAIRNLPR